MDQAQLFILEKLNNALARHSEQEIAEILAAVDWVSLLSQKTIGHCRRQEKISLVIFLCTLAKHNEIEAEKAEKWLEIYQSIQSGQLSKAIATDSVIGQIITGIISRTGVTSTELNPAKGRALDWLDAFELTLDLKNWESALQILKVFSHKKDARKHWDKFCKILSQRHNLYIERQTRLPILNIDYPILAEIYKICREGAKKSGITLLNEPLTILEANIRELATDYIGSIALIKQQKSFDDYFLNLYDIARCQCRMGNLAESVQTLDRSIEKFGQKIQHTDNANADIINQENPKQKNEVFNTAAASIALADLISILGNKDLKGFLVSGTLLGYARQGALLDHDKDIDIGVIGWDKQYDVYIALQESGKFVLSPSFLKGHRMHYLPICHKTTGTSIDVFFYHVTDGKMITGVDFVFGYQQRFAFTPFELAAVRFLDVDMYIPEDFDLNLRENFGEWRIPDPSYLSHLESPSTVDKGNYQYMLTARVTTLNSLLKQQPAKLFKIADLMEEHAEKPGAMSKSLIAKIRKWAQTMLNKRDHAHADAGQSVAEELQHA